MKAFDARAFAAAGLRVDLRNIEDVDVDWVIGPGWDDSGQSRLAAAFFADAATAFVVIAGNDFRGVEGVVRNAAKDIFRGVGREVGDELVVDSEVGGKDEEMADALD